MVLGLPPVLAGVILAVVAGLVLFAEVIGKVVVAIVELAWYSIRPHARHA